MCKIRRHVLGFVASLYIWGPVITSEGQQGITFVAHQDFTWSILACLLTSLGSSSLDDFLGDHQETATTEHFPSMTAMTNKTETPKEEDEEDEEEDDKEENKLEKNRRECN
uniref:Protein phosphatase 1, regulatory (Inhibitor) subunit 1B n=1 Tax=Nothobranchius furzeri TaxID=105023 RepID=A0A1A8A053_NOTFU